MDYNDFMKRTIKTLKEENPTLRHDQAFALATHEWNKEKRRVAKEQAGGRKREPTEYNKYMSKEIHRQQDLHPDATPKEVFSYAAKGWKN